MISEIIFSDGKFTYTGNNFSGIYGIKCNITDKWYVGESINVLRRTRKYINGINKNQCLISKAIKKYGIENFTCYKLEECNIDKLHEKEIYWGNKLNSLSPNGYNLRLGGKGKSIVSLETREKMRQANIGKKLSKETIQKIKLITSSMSNETKRKMSISQTGKKHSEKTRQKIKAIHQLNRTIKWLEKEAPWFCETSLEETTYVR